MKELNQKQLEILHRLELDFQEAFHADLGLANVDGFGVVAYNAENVSCFDCPSDAAYDGGKRLVDATKFRRTKIGRNFIPECATKVLVGFDN